MYHLDGTDYLKEKYYHKTKSVCPECLNKIDAEIIEENDEIFMDKTCPECKRDFRDKLSSSAKWYKWTHYSTEEWSFDKDGETNPADCKGKDPRGCPYNCHKTVEGYVAGFLGSFGVALLALLIFEPDVDLIKILIVASAGAIVFFIIDLLDLKVDDNMLNPIFCSMVMALLFLSI